MVLNQVPWVFKTASSDLLKLVSTDMSLSKLFDTGNGSDKTSVAAKKRAAPAPAPKKSAAAAGVTANAAAAKRARKAMTVADGGEKLSLILMPEKSMNLLQIPTVGFGDENADPNRMDDLASDVAPAGAAASQQPRPQQWLENMVMAGTHVIDSHKATCICPADSNIAEAMGKVYQKALAIFISVSLEFCFCKQVTLRSVGKNGKSTVYKVWSQLRPAIQGIVHESLTVTFRALSSTPTTASSTALAPSSEDIGHEALGQALCGVGASFSSSNAASTSAHAQVALESLLAACDADYSASTSTESSDGDEAKAAPEAAAKASEEDAGVAETSEEAGT